MSNVTFKWEGEERLTAIEKAMQQGVAEASNILETAIKMKLSRVGRFKSFDQQSQQSDRDFVASQGFVDDPGGSPRLRSGRLRRSINTRREGKYARLVGVFGDLAYAAIHEFGGQINHPGGTPYVIVDRNGKPWAVFLRKSSQRRPPTAKGRVRKDKQQAGSAGYAALVTSGQQLKFTKPYTINMPARPYIRPAFDENRNRMLEAFRARVKKASQEGDS